MMPARDWLTIAGQSLGVFMGLVVVGFGPAFNPGWANGWPLGLSIHSVWSTGMSLLFFQLLMAALAGVGAVAGAACACLGIGLRHGRTVYAGWLACSGAMALLASLWVFRNVYASTLEAWPGGYNP